MAVPKAVKKVPVKKKAGAGGKKPAGKTKAPAKRKKAAPTSAGVGHAAARPSVKAPGKPAPVQVNVPQTPRERKVALRKEMRVSLEKMRGRAERSRQLVDAIISHPSWRRAVIVAIFAPMEHEPDVELLWKHAEGKTMCYPTIRLGGLDFMGVVGPESVMPGQFGIREPVFDQARVIPPDTFDLIFVPGAAFTVSGERLGRGGGFYDRVLATPGFRAFKVGVCFDRQVLAEVPIEPHDERVHRVVTENGWLQRPGIAAGKAREDAGSGVRMKK
jgi:5-formyltetrahydrofolate cyclo-ligase